MRYRRGKQTFLNPPDSCDSGAVTWSIDCIKREHVFIEADASFWDCSRKICLDFDASTKREYKRRRTKLRKLKASIDALEAAYIEAGKLAGWEKGNE